MQLIKYLVSISMVVTVLESKALGNSTASSPSALPIPASGPAAKVGKVPAPASAPSPAVKAVSSAPALSTSVPSSATPSDGKAPIVSSSIPSSQPTPSPSNVATSPAVHPSSSLDISPKGAVHPIAGADDSHPFGGEPAAHPFGEGGESTSAGESTHPIEEAKPKKPKIYVKPGDSKKCNKSFKKAEVCVKYLEPSAFLDNTDDFCAFYEQFIICHQLNANCRKIQDPDMDQEMQEKFVKHYTKRSRIKPHVYPNPWHAEEKLAICLERIKARETSTKVSAAKKKTSMNSNSSWFSPSSSSSSSWGASPSSSSGFKW